MHYTESSSGHVLETATHILTFHHALDKDDYFGEPVLLLGYEGMFRLYSRLRRVELPRLSFRDPEESEMVVKMTVSDGRMVMSEPVPLLIIGQREFILPLTSSPGHCGSLAVSISDGSILGFCVGRSYFSVGVSYFSTSPDFIRNQ
jgi:hypothetical protein